MENRISDLSSYFGGDRRGNAGSTSYRCDPAAGLNGAKTVCRAGGDCRLSWSDGGLCCGRMHAGSGVDGDLFKVTIVWKKEQAGKAEET